MGLLDLLLGRNEHGPTGTPPEDVDPSQSNFAYGDSDVGSVSCPAVLAPYHVKEPWDVGPGMKADPAAKSLVAAYDDQFEDDRGVVPEDRAREAWLAAIEERRDQKNHTAVEFGEAVAEHFGWES